MEGTDVVHLSAVAKLGRVARPRHEPEVEEAIDNFEEARTKSREVHMLELRFGDGRLMHFDYAHLFRSEFVPEDKIVLWFGGFEVTAKGKNLRHTYASITERRRRYIEEGTDKEEAAKPEDAAHIDTIEVRPDTDKRPG
jgi:hypothetical protein